MYNIFSFNWRRKNKNHKKYKPISDEGENDSHSIKLNNYITMSNYTHTYIYVCEYVSTSMFIND